MREIATKEEAAPKMAMGTAKNKMEISDSKKCQKSQPGPVSHEITACANALGVFGGQIKEDQWEVIQMIRRNLYAAAEYAAALERSLEIPRGR